MTQSPDLEDAALLRAVASGDEDAGWSLLALSIATCCERTRYAALSGAIAAPVTFVAIAAASFLPPLDRHLLSPPDTARAATIAWYSIAAAAGALAILAIRDQWNRYTRRLHRWI